MRGNRLFKSTRGRRTKVYNIISVKCVSGLTVLKVTILNDSLKRKIILLRKIEKTELALKCFATGANDDIIRPPVLTPSARLAIN